MGRTREGPNEIELTAIWGEVGRLATRTVSSSFNTVSLYLVLQACSGKVALQALQLQGKQLAVSTEGRPTMAKGQWRSSSSRFRSTARRRVWGGRGPSGALQRVGGG